MAFTPKTAISFLGNAQERGRLAHAYLITGAPGSGKSALAADLAQLVNGASAEEILRGNAPDIYFASPESKSRRIVIEQIRELEHALQLRAADGRRKVAIISEADRMQPQAANAFLKTLEEPPNNSLLLLLSSIPEALPDTIVSRCLEIALLSPNDHEFSGEEKELLEILAGWKPRSREEVHQAYLLAQALERLLGRIRTEIDDENTAAYKAEKARYRQTTEGNWLENREEHYEALTVSRYLEKRSRLIEILFLWWGDVLRASIGLEKRELPKERATTEAVAARLSTREVLRRLRRLEALRSHLGRNVQEALAIEAAFLQIFRLREPAPALRD